jgi:hypothetical protein
MKHTLALLFILALSATLFAACTYDRVVNTGSESVISCTNVSTSGYCFAVFSSANQSVLVPKDAGPGFVFAPATDNAGNVALSYLVDARFEFGLDYNFSLFCSNASSSSTNTGVISITNGRAPTFLMQWTLWAKDNAGWVVFFAFLMILVGVYMRMNWNSLMS